MSKTYYWVFNIINNNCEIKKGLIILTRNVYYLLININNYYDLLEYFKFLILKSLRTNSFYFIFFFNQLCIIFSSLYNACFFYRIYYTTLSYYKNYRFVFHNILRIVMLSIIIYMCRYLDQILSQYTVP